MRLFKSTVVIISPFRPDDVQLSHLAREAEQGEAYVERFDFEQIDAGEELDENRLSIGAAEFFRMDDARQPVRVLSLLQRHCGRSR